MIDIFLFEIYFISFYIIIVNQITIWDVGQTVKMSACHAARSGFNSRTSRKYCKGNVYKVGITLFMQESITMAMIE